MIHVKSGLFIHVLIASITVSLSGQLAQTEQIFFDVAPVFSKTVTDEQLASAESLSDIYDGYPMSWIQHYESTTIIITSDKSQTITEGTGNKLSKAQRKALSEGPIGGKILLKVLHSDSAQTKKASQEIKLTTTIVPTLNAQYGTGHDDLMTYMRTKALSVIHQNPSFEFDQARISFVVNEEGKVLTPKLEESSQNAYIDKMLMNAVGEMDSWTPARDKNNRTISQRFELRIGNSYGC